MPHRKSIFFGKILQFAAGFFYGKKNFVTLLKIDNYV